MSVLLPFSSTAAEAGDAVGDTFHEEGAPRVAPVRPRSVPRPPEAPRFAGERSSLTGGERSQRSSALRAWLETRSPAPKALEASGLSFSIHELDTQMPGGPPRGALCELVASGPSVGAQRALLSLAGQAARQAWRTGLVDATDRFDPGTCPPALLRHLLWVRASGAVPALRAADTLARDGNLPLLLIDLLDVPAAELRAFPAATWFRLQRAAEAAASCLLLLTPRPLVPSAARRLHLQTPLRLRALEAAVRSEKEEVRTQKLPTAPPTLL